MNAKNLKRACIPGIIVVTLVVVLAPIFAAGDPASSTSANSRPSNPETLELDAERPAAFTFANDSKIVEYELTIPSSTGVNITLSNTNGTRLSWTVDVDLEVKLNGRVVQQRKCVYSGSAGNNAKNTPEPDTFTYLAVEEIVMRVCVMATSHYNASYDDDDGKFQLAGGTIEAATSWREDENTLTQGIKSVSVNFSAGTSGSDGFTAKVFTVLEDGWYLFKLNATRGSVTEGPQDLNVVVLHLGKADAATMEERVGVVRGQFESAARLTLNTGEDEKYLTHEPAYLEKDEKYLILFLDPTGGFDDVKGYAVLSWIKLNVASGDSGSSADTENPETTTINIDFTSVNLTVAREENNKWSAWVALDSFVAGKAYNLSIDAVPSDLGWWKVTANFLGAFNLNDMGAGWGQKGRVFFVPDSISAQRVVNGHNYALGPQFLAWNRKIAPGVLGGLNGTNEVWKAPGRVELESWTHQIARVTVENESTFPQLPTVRLVVGGDAHGIPALSPSGTVLEKKNVGGGDDMGLYLLENMKGKELDFTFSELGTAINPTYTVSFFTPCDWTTRGLYGVAATAFGTTTFTFKNTTVTHGGDMPAWDDAPEVFEVAVFQDKVYVLITGTWPTLPNLANTSSVKISYTATDFLTSGQAFNVSRDNDLVVYKASLGPCTTAKLEGVYGACCSLSATANVAACDTFVVDHASSWTITNLDSAWPYCISVDGYVVLSTATFTDGSVVKLTITAAPSAIPGYPVFFTLVASLGVVAFLVW
ncbi:MAG: hypothetical protein ACTSU5_21490, partial [Promethearchaeota archaeon]